MNFQKIKEYCLSKRGVTENYPFDETTTVFKVGSKMFALTQRTDNPYNLSLKCEPFLSQDLRKDYPGIKPGYHLNKIHWNTVELDGSIEDEKIYWMIDLSYDLVFKGLRKSEKLDLK